MNKKTLEFTKMEGAGNDFVVIDNRAEPLPVSALSELAPLLCRRRFGVGADGLLALNPPDKPELDYTMIYRNADGSDAGMCGNGARCLALYAHSMGLGKNVRFSVHDAVYTAELSADGEVVVRFPHITDVRALEIDSFGRLYQSRPGTEHIVMEVAPDELTQHKKLTDTGRALREHPLFNPPGTNVNFISGTEKRNVRLQTYERGVEGLTLACGTGAIASALTWHHLQESDETEAEIVIKTEGGTLSVAFSFDPENGAYSDIRLKGPARFVFEGTWTQQ